MKLPSCHCGSITGWLHDIQCKLCGCFPWQHSSDESEYDSSDGDDEEARLELARNEIRLEIEEEKRKKIELVNRAIFVGNYCIKADEDRFLMVHSMWEKEKENKKKRLRSWTFRNSLRTTKQGFEPKHYQLDVYDYYKKKEQYEFEVVLDYLQYLGLRHHALSKTKQYLDADLRPSEIQLLDYEDFLQQ